MTFLNAILLAGAAAFLIPLLIHLLNKRRVQTVRWAAMHLLQVLRKKGHEIIAIQLWDRDELEFPFSQWSRFENLEKDDDSLLLDPATIRQRYQEVRQKFQEELKEGFRKHQVDYLPLHTDEPHAAALRSYLALRMR